MFEAIKLSCPSFVIYKYAHDTPVKAITTKEHIKGNLTSIRDYFNGTSPIEKEGDLYKIDEVKGQVTWWFRYNNSLCHKRRIK